MSIQGAELCSTGPTLEEEVILMVQPKDVAEHPRGRPWQDGREEPCWEAQWQEFLWGLDSSYVDWGKEPSPWEDTKAFLASFEQVAKACQWPREVWMARLLPALSGEAQKAFANLKGSDREDYGKVKAAILYSEANRMEALRQHFRQFRSKEMEDPRQIYNQLQELCHRWLRPERHSKEQILELLILEQFLVSLPPELQSWIRAGSPENYTQAMIMVDSFLLSRQGVQAEKQQGPLQEVSLGAQDAEGEFWVPTQRQISKDAKEDGDGEITLLVCTQEGLFVPKNELEKKEEMVAQHPEECERFSGQDLGSGTQQCPHSSSSLPLDKQERIKVGQMEALITLEETGVSLQRTEQQLTQDQGQRTMFWQVLPDSSGKVDSFEMFLAPRTDLSFHLEKEDISLQFPEGRGIFTGQNSGDEKGSQFRVGVPSCGGNKPGDPEKTQGDVLVMPEIEVEIYDSNEEWRTKSLQGQNESQGFSESLRAVCSQTHPEHQRKEEPLFSRYGRKYLLNSRLVTGLTRGDWDECSTSEKNSDLDEPQRITTGEKSYKCPIRGRSPKGVMRNQSGQTGKRKYDCPACRNSFTPKSLVSHLKIHGDQASYACSVCGKSFKRKEHLIRHLRLHTGEKPFKCPECGISFYRTDELQRHQISHGKKMPYECPQCGKDFYQRSLMVKHQRIHN